ncbi:MAG: hypothetical protein M3015_00720 [Bacteroidota bacterium]|nr:hypothetical protein [Bacteroidota bacterium]
MNQLKGNLRVSFFIFLIFRASKETFTRTNLYSTIMKAASINELKKELERKNNADLISYCLRLSKFKKENKELLTFLLFEADDISKYIEDVKLGITDLFNELNHKHIYFVKKGIRKILRLANKFIRMAASKHAEAEILIQFCNSFRELPISLSGNKQLSKLYNTQIDKVEKVLSTLHPDLQYDLKRQLN